MNGQLEKKKGETEAWKVLQPVLKYGLLRERMAALLTDGLRGEYLESEGYDVQVLEFIDMEHTPKNILSRPMKKKGKQKVTAKEQITECQTFFGIDPMLGKLLD